MVNILVSNKKMDRTEVAEVENRLVNVRRLQNLKISLCEVSPNKDYDFAEFLYDVRQGILSYHSGVGDVIHSVIMKNNEIATILTFDEKDDFKQLPYLTVIHPRDVKIKRSKLHTKPKSGPTHSAKAVRAADAPKTPDA